MKIGEKSLSFVLILAFLGFVGCGGGSDEPSQADNSSTEGTGEKDPATPDKPSNLFPRVVVNTNMGAIVLELDAEKAPITVQNFLDYVDDAHYDNTIFHQVISDAIVLGGGFTPEFKRKAEGIPIYNEADNGLKNVRGSIAMARLPGYIDSATCQFFINVVDNPSFDHQSRDGDPEDYGYCVFGRVVKGMEVVEKLTTLSVADREEGGETFPSSPTRTVRIDSVRRY